MHRSLWMAALFTLISAIASASPPRVRRANRHTGRTQLERFPIVRGLDGQADLLLDVGRSLQRYPLRKKTLRARYGINNTTKKSRLWLNSLEKVRLDARRIGVASTLDIGQQLDRFVTIVRHRMPLTPEAEQRYERVSSSQVKGWGIASLSQHNNKRVGICRERAFLLKTMLKEIGIKASVRYGVLYDNANNYIDGHAWVEANVNGRKLLMDPSTRNPIQKKQSISIDEAMPNGTVRRVKGVQTSDFLYVPTNDLFISAPSAHSRAKSSYNR